MTASKKRSWRAAVRAAHAIHQEFGFAECAPSVNPPDRTRPLLLIIHPGDAIEDGIGMRKEDAEEVIEFGRKNALGMAAEINEKLPTHDVVVLHRLSSVDTFMTQFYDFAGVGKMIAPYCKACIKASEIGSVLYGDDLESCAKWLIKHMDVTSRPHIFMTGAYAGENDGCITFVGKALARAGCASITMSDHAPTDASNYTPRWDPQKTIAEVAAAQRMPRP